MTRKLQTLIGVSCLAISALAQDIPSLKIHGPDRNLDRMPDGQRPQRLNNTATTAQIPKENIPSKATSVESWNVKLVTMDGVVGYMVTPIESIEGHTLTPLNQSDSKVEMDAPARIPKEIIASKATPLESSTVKLVTMDGVVGYMVTPTESIIAVK